MSDETNYQNFMLSDGRLSIVDYELIDRELLFLKDSNTVALGDRKAKKGITSIKVLIELFRKLSQDVCKNISDEQLPYSFGNKLDFQFWIPPINDHFLYQLVFDVLYDKYRNESPELTLNEYCSKYISSEWNGLDLPEGKIDYKINYANKWMAKEVRREVDISNNPAMRANAKKLGVDPDLHLEHLSLNTRFKVKNKRPKCLWDYVYYNGYPKLLTFKQFERKINKQIKYRNYNLDTFADDFKKYDLFVQKFMPKEGDTDKDYFIKSLDFYNLEIYKRLDFIYKLAVIMERESVSDIDRNHFMVKRFHPEVSCPYIDNNSLCYSIKNKYYRPFLFIEKAWSLNLQHTLNQTDNFSVMYHIIRAKTYERFRFNFQFISDDYNDISNFIRNHYDVLSYHEPNKDWFTVDKQKKVMEQRLRNAIKINDALFWESDKREPAKWEKP